MTGVRNSLKDTAKEADKVQQKVSQWGSALGGVGAGMAAVGGLMTAGLGLASKAASDFGQQIARVRTVISEADFATADIKKTTMGLAASYGIPALKEADGLYETISAGITDADEATRLLEVANEFAVGGTTDLMGAVDVLTSSVNTYADTGLTAQKASDLMFTAIAAGKTTAEELSHSLGEVAPTAHAAGVSFEELQAAIAAMTVQGIKTPQAVTGLNALMSNLIKPSKDAADEAQRLGIEFDATALKTKGLKGVLAQLTTNTKVNNDTFGKLFGSIDGIKAALTLTSGGGAKFNEILGMMKDSSGATGKAFEIMADTTHFQGERMKALAENSKILIGEALEPLKMKGLKAINDLLEGFNKMSPETRDMIVKVAAVGAGFLTMGGGALMLVSKIGPLVEVFSSLLSSEALGGVVAAAGPVIAVVAALGAVFAGFGVAIDANVGGIGDTLGGVFSDIKLAVQGVIQLFTQGGFSGAVAEEFQKGESGPLNFALRVYAVFEDVKNFLSGVWEGFQSTIKSAEPTFTKFGAAISSLGDAFGGLMGGASDTSAQFDAMGAAGQSTGDKIGKLVTVIVDVMTVGINIVTGFVAAWKTIEPAISQVGSAIGGIMGTVGELVDSLGMASGGASGATSTFTELGTKLAGIVAATLKHTANLIRDIGSVFSNIVGAIKGGVEIVTGILSGDWARVWHGMREIVFSSISTMIDMFFMGIQAIADGVDTLLGLVGIDLGAGKAVRDLKDSMKDTIKDLMGLKAPEITGTAQTGLAPTPAAPPIPNAEVSSTINPTLAMITSDMGQSIDPNAIGAATGDAVAASIAPLIKPPPPLNVNLNVDGERIQNWVMQQNPEGPQPPAS